MDDQHPSTPERLDVGGAINSVENALRDVISRVLEQLHGDSWFDHLGATEERVAAWKQRREEEPKRRPGGEVDDRLLHYAEFHDLAVAVRKNWQHGFRECFRDNKRFDVYMDRLGAFRNPDAHSRALLPFEEHLVLGMAGEIRQEITLFLSQGGGGTEPEYFARIEHVVDSYGLRVVGTATAGILAGTERSQAVLRPGELVTFRGTAWDPEGAALRWRITPESQPEVTIDGASFEWEWIVRETDIGDTALVRFRVIADRPYSRFEGSDDSATFLYRVLPRR